MPKANPQLQSQIEERMERWTEALINAEALPMIIIGKRDNGQAEMLFHGTLSNEAVAAVLRDAANACED